MYIILFALLAYSPILGTAPGTGDTYRVKKSYQQIEREDGVDAAFLVAVIDRDEKIADAYLKSGKASPEGIHLGLKYALKKDSDKMATVILPYYKKLKEDIKNALSSPDIFNGATPLTDLVHDYLFGHYNVDEVEPKAVCWHAE